jgi:hypothetical protein
MIGVSKLSTDAGTKRVVDCSGNSAPNVSIVGASIGGSTYTLYDEMTSTKLNDSYFAMHVLGVSAGGGDGYSRFTTSVKSAAASWGQGNGNPPSQCNKRSALLEHFEQGESVCVHSLEHLRSALRAKDSAPGFRDEIVAAAAQTDKRKEGSP